MKSDSRRVAALWLVGILAVALIVAACGESTPEPADSPVSGGSTPAADLAPTATSTPPPPPTPTAVPPSATPSPPPTPIAIPPTATPPPPNPTPVPPTATPPPSPIPVPPTPTPEPCVLAPPDIGLSSTPPEGELERFLSDLTREFSPRRSARDGEYAAGQELRCLLTAMGYETEFQEFDTRAPYAADGYESVVSVGPDAPPGLEAIESHPMVYSPEGEATAELIFVGYGRAEDIGDRQLEGKVALIERGRITFQEKVKRAETEGAVAAIIFNSEDALLRGRLAPVDLTHIPSVGIGRAHGLALAKAIESDEVQVTVRVELAIDPSRNLIAELPGSPSQKGIVIIGAHYDTVASTQGANDNGSGITALMAIASRLIDHSYPFGVRFVLFGAEEIGLFGSRHYVDQLPEDEKDKIIAMVNLDVTGSGESLRVMGDSNLTNAVSMLADTRGIALTVLPYDDNLRSDHSPFHNQGIPSVILLGDDWSRANSPDDTLEFINPRLIAESVELTLAMLTHLEPEPQKTTAASEATPVP